MTLARYVNFAVKGDSLGWLVALEGDRNVPFPIKRTYYIFGTQPGVRRGKHAHHKLRQVMICLTGQCKVLLDDGNSREDVTLSRNDRGLFIDPMVWHEMHDFSRDCVLLVLADDWYDETDYVRDYGAFKNACDAAR
jgi:dTDP-4-dehydrorhamnose 3,5-epimerase-like enzyme